MASEKKNPYEGMLAENAFWKAADSRSLSGAYLLFGEEALTRQMAIDKVVSMLEPDGRALNCQTVNPSSADELLSACSQLPFFDTMRVVLLRDWDSGLAGEIAGRPDQADGEKDDDDGQKPGKKRRGAQREILKLIDPATILLIVMQGENKKDPLYTYFSKWDKSRMVPFLPLTEDRAVNFLMREAALAGVRLSRPEAVLTVRLCGLDGYRLRNEFSKAAALAGPGGTVTEEIISLAVTKSEEAEAFDILDMLVAGNKKKGMRLLEGDLNRDKGVAFAYAGLFLSRLKPMLRARTFLDAGKRPDEAAKLLGGSPYYAKKIVQQASNMSAEKIRAAITAFSEVDVNTKLGVSTPEEALVLAVYKYF